MINAAHLVKQTIFIHKWKSAHLLQNRLNTVQWVGERLELLTTSLLNVSECFYIFMKLIRKCCGFHEETLEKFTTQNSPHSISALSCDELEWIKCGNENIDNGRILQKKDIQFLRPCPVDSIEPFEFKKVIGKKLLKNKLKGEYIKWEDLE